MLRPSPNHRTLHLPNEEDDDVVSACSNTVVAYVTMLSIHGIVHECESVHEFPILKWQPD